MCHKTASIDRGLHDQSQEVKLLTEKFQRRRLKKLLREKQDRLNARDVKKNSRAL